MKKEDVLGTFVYFLLLGIAAIYIFAILGPRATASGLGDLYILFNLLSVVAGAVFSALVIEIGHIIGAKIGGYIVTYVSVLGITLKKENEKWKLCFSNFEGLTGETRIAPNREDINKCNPYPYLFAGTISFIIELIFVLIFFFLNKNEVDEISNVAYFLLNMLGVGALCFIYNIIPAKLDCVTDGYNLLLFANRKNREAFNELLKVNYELSQGKKAEIRVFDEITNFTADLNMKKAYLLIGESKYEEAGKIIDVILANRKDISYDVYLKAKSENIYIKYMSLPMEEADKFYQEQVDITERRDIAKEVRISCIRAYFLMSGISDKSRSECIVCIERENKVIKHLDGTIKNTEINLFNSALEKVCELHPKWELEKYRISTLK